MSYKRDATGLNRDTTTARSMERQAIINGNFDIWQRGTSFTDPQTIFTADRYYTIYGTDGGTGPTITHTRQQQTSGALDKSYYFYRISPNGAGSGYGNVSYYTWYQKIEHGTRYLCGNGKAVTVSFKARSSIAGKKIGMYLSQTYGTGGSPSSAETKPGPVFTLTSGWEEYTYVFYVNTLSGKTFGTNNDDNLTVGFMFQWGSTVGSVYLGQSTSETWVGSGDIDIAQVQVCAGDVALPFEPKTYDEELRACQRYYYQPSTHVATGIASAITVLASYCKFPVTMRSAPTVTITSPGVGGVNYVRNVNANTGVAVSSINIMFNTSMTDAFLGFWVGSGTPFTAGLAYDHSIILSAEL